MKRWEPIPTLSATTGSNTLAVQRIGGSIAWSTGIVKNGGDLNVSYFYRDGVSLGNHQCGRCLMDCWLYNNFTGVVIMAFPTNPIYKLIKNRLPIKMMV